MVIDGSTAASTRPQPAGRWRIITKLWFWIIVAIAAGIVLGLTAPTVAVQMKWLADTFIQLIRVVAPPIIFCSIVVGIASLGDLRKVGKLGSIALGYFFAMTTLCLALGMVVANLVKPGAGFEGDPGATALEKAQEDLAQASDSEGIVGFIRHDILPSSFVQPFVENAILQVVVLAIVVACAVSVLTPTLRESVVRTFETVNKVVFGIIRIVMFTAPLGAFGGIAYTTGQFGSQSLGSLGLLMLAFWLTCIMFVFVILGAIAAWSGFNIFKFVRMIKDELLIVLGTSSSETVLPRFLAKLEAAGASRRVVSLTVPTGYSFNLDGTAIYMAMAALFIAQAGGTDLSLGAQLALLGLMLITSKGAAGVSGASVVTLAATLQAFGTEFFPPSTLAVGIALVIGIDRVMSEGKALTSVVGVAAGTMIIAKLAGERDDDAFQRALDNPATVRDAITQEMLPTPQPSPLPRSVALERT
ncbi:cation:dicarboxylate symporter family transporter [Mycolicibacterium baixiangningiae]|uniref:cation:dicarboxylate symporter family transporter n=1 Tax=Mycolicibacterium baixiangningiae TaxID=2761578 RepID=UPI001867D326|nr:cation:dicarboxylase symporter family transporter [Mycolicibacterium baixiangningiae]